ncbi:aarF domain-containing protein kinase 1 isoform X3 [Pelodiscus sinensis]|uniref:aarF domain-containing protein kinase 1 isoform X3 n=1 Tax=Pelodiscus sinensis TaxID=13735 RepID=UPI003F6D71A2
MQRGREAVPHAGRGSLLCPSKSIEAVLSSRQLLSLMTTSLLSGVSRMDHRSMPTSNHRLNCLPSVGLFWHEGTEAGVRSAGVYMQHHMLSPQGALQLTRQVRPGTSLLTIMHAAYIHTHWNGHEQLLKEQQLQKVHLRSAERLRDLCCANRGTFIKVGQHLGALDYLLPEEYTRTLKVLHSQAPQSSMQEIEQVIREDLGKEIKELFVSFEDTPLGAASLAQVHKAVLQDGRTVAVKVQHPKVQAQSSKDILLMEILLLTVKQIFPDFEFMWLVDEAKKNLPLELDFLNEGKNAEKVAHMLKDFDFLKISRNLGKLYSEMIFVNGFVHCDPHPGNVLVRKCPATGKAHIVLLDHGLYQVLTQKFRLDYCRLWQSLIKADMKRVQKYSRRLGAGDLYPLFACMLTARSWDSVNRGIDRSPVTASEDVEIRTNAATYLPQINQLLNNVPRQMLLLLKTNDLLRGIESALRTRASASSFLNMSRCCIRAVSTYQRSKSHSLYKKAQISLLEALSLWQINLYELFLRLKGTRLGNWVIAFLSRMHHSLY